jgi:anti-sigma B factor antagonist
MSYLQDFETNKIKLALFNLSDKVKGVFQILGLDQLIKIVSTKEEAKTIVNGL